MKTTKREISLRHEGYVTFERLEQEIKTITSRAKNINIVFVIPEGEFRTYKMTYEEE